MTMKTIYKLSLVILFSFWTFSCNVLDQVSPNDVENSNVFKSTTGAQSALIGLYSSLQARDYYGGYFPMLADLYSDVSVGGGFDNIALNEISDEAITPANIFVQNTYLALYYTVATANHIIEGVELVKDPTFTAEIKNSIKGQALAVRAMAHFDALRMFGQHWNNASFFGVPIVLSVQKATDLVPRSSVAQSYSAIIKDLQDALPLLDASDQSKQFITAYAVESLLARVFLYQGDMANALQSATNVIDANAYEMLDENNFSTIYTGRLTSESIFELSFDVQNRSSYNILTYSRDDALRTEILWLAEESLNTFFINRPGDARAALVDFDPANNDSGIIPDGRSQKYRGEETRNNPAYILRLAELHLIRAEAYGFTQEGIDELNVIRSNRGLADYQLSDFGNKSQYIDAVMDERKAEFNFEGHRMFDLARINKTALSIFPFPQREITTSQEILAQNPGY